MANSRVFISQALEDESSNSNLEHDGALVEETLDDGVIQLKTNKIPRGIVTLERLFDHDMICHQVTARIDVEDVETVNLGTESEPKNILFGKSCIEAERVEIIHIIQEFIDIIAWKYEHLKTYDPSIITHTIPLKPNMKPFKQKV